MRAVTFDVWNTLLRLNSIYVEIASKASKELGLGFNKALELIRGAYVKAKTARREGRLPSGEGVIDASLKIMADELGCGREELSGIIEDAFNSIDSGNLVIEGALSVVRMVKSMGLRVGVLGNVLFWSSDLTVKALRRSGFNGLIDAYVFADRVGYSKPDVRIFRHALRELRVRPQEAMHVGDGVVEDLGGALSSCMAAALITPQVSQVVSIGREIHFIPSIKHLPEIIRRV